MKKLPLFLIALYCVSLLQTNTSLAFTKFEEPPLAAKYAYFTAQIGSIPIGYAVLSIDAENTIPKVTFFTEITSRVGTSPLSCQVKQESIGKETTFTVNTACSIHNQIKLLQENKFQITANKITRLSQLPTENVSSFFLGTSNSKSISETTWNENSFPLIYKSFEKNSELNALYFFPFNEQILSYAEINPTFAPDGLPEQFTYAFTPNINIKFIRKNKQQCFDDFEYANLHPIDFSWFTSQTTIEKELKNLQITAEECATVIHGIEKNIKTKNPGISYILHRKLINLSNICTKIKNINNTKSSIDNEKTLLKIATEFKSIEKEPRRELPSAISENPDWVIFSNSDLQWQYSQVATWILKNSQNEITTLFAIEEKRKIDVNLTIHTSKQENRAVLKANIKLVKFDIPISLITTPPAQLDKAQSAITFASSESNPLTTKETCETQKGVIGIDLSETKETIIRGAHMRGFLDNTTRERILIDFLYTVLGENSCKEVKIYIQPTHKAIFLSILENIKKEMFSTENNVQISNGKSIRLKLFPGTFTLTLSSFVNGNTIGKKDFEITNKKSISINIP